MPIVTWQEKLDSIGTHKPVANGGSAGVYWADYHLPDGYWRYTWTNFTLEPHPDFAEVNQMDGYNE